MINCQPERCRKEFNDQPWPTRYSFGLIDIIVALVSNAFMTECIVNLSLSPTTPEVGQQNGSVDIRRVDSLVRFRLSGTCWDYLQEGRWGLACCGRGPLQANHLPRGQAFTLSALLDSMLNTEYLQACAGEFKRLAATIHKRNLVQASAFPIPSSSALKLTHSFVELQPGDRGHLLEIAKLLSSQRISDIQEQLHKEALEFKWVLGLSV